MLDGMMRGLIDAPLNRGGLWLAQRGASANAMTLVGLALGLGAASLIAAGLTGPLALLMILLSRLADGLDGAVARARGKTDFGGYLDIACDFAFYAAIPAAFVIADPVQNGAAGAVLLASFYVNGATFLGFAILAAKKGMETKSRGEKSLYFTAGLLEGTETILFFVIIVLWPSAFATAAWVFAGLCLVTAVSRVLLARRVFGG